MPAPSDGQNLHAVDGTRNRGAENTGEAGADATRHFRGSAFKCRTAPTPDATVPPMCEQGPSLPAEPPDASVIKAATGFTSMVLNGIRPDCRCTAEMLEPRRPVLLRGPAQYSNSPSNRPPSGSMTM